MKSAIITTTINIPALLEEYIKNAIEFQHNCFFVVVGDKKTPAGTKDFCLDLQKKYNVELYFLDVSDQLQYLEKFPELAEHLPYNSIQRRNIALIFAYEKKADYIITIDDDNYFLKGDFVGLHKVGVEKEMDIISHNDGWINVCDFLQEEYNREFYHRGLPLERRFLKKEFTIEKNKVYVTVNAGLWLGDPDIDALTRLYYLNKPINVTGYLRKENFALDKNTWSPFNSQNTSLAREVIPAYFLSPYVGRYDDIWASFVIKKIADHLDHYISYGFPLVNQERNIHNYWNDFAKEDMGMILSDKFIKILKEITLSKGNYLECYVEVAEKIIRAINFIEMDASQSDYFNKYIKGMRVWIKTFDRLNK